MSIDPEQYNAVSIERDNLAKKCEGLVRQLEEETDEYDRIMMNQSRIMTDVVNALLGPPKELCMHSHHNLAELARAAVRERDYYKAALNQLETMVLKNEAPDNR